MSRAGEPVEHCAHPVARHTHGTHTAYLRDGCRCEPCRAAAVRAVKRWKLDRSRGRARMVPSEKVRLHLEALRSSGMSIRDIERASGMSRSAVTRALHPDREMMWAVSAARWLALPVPVAPDGHGYVAALGSSRRLQALGALGWAQSVLAAHLGWDRNQVQRVALARMRQVRGSTAADVRRVYGLLSGRPAEGPCVERVRRASLAKGWVPPLAWPQEADLDDPATEPLPRWMWDPTMSRDSARRQRARALAATGHGVGVAA